ncbi:hypothetical protein K3495_g2966 [Podosphaera aphanis]|nr:hypothetical protein K3495_g2966 [Podosphaera aphanis]
MHNNDFKKKKKETLQQFNFKLEWRPGNACDRPDALSCRDQDKPVKLDDERNAGRVMQLMQAPQINVTTFHKNSATEDIGITENDETSGKTLFDEDELQQLWSNAVKEDEARRRARDAVKLGERSFPADIALIMTANISECTVSADNVLRGRENRVWVPNYEPLRAAIMQRTHDSHLSGHPGRDTMLSILLQRWFWPKMRSYFGFPRNLTSDRGSDWLSHFWQFFCKSVGISQRLTTAYHPQSNASERANQELFKYLRTFTCYAQNDWADLLPMAQLALNLRPSSAIGGMSPFFLRHGYNINSIQEHVTDNGRRHPGKISAEKLVNRLREAQDFAPAAIATAQQLYEENANCFRKQPETFKVGDKVWLNLRNVNTLRPSFQKNYPGYMPSTRSPPSQIP